MSDTPRTDADLQTRGSYFGPVEYVSSDFARQLERELAEARREIERLRDALIAFDGVPCPHAGCLHHVSHPCENCGRIAGRWGRMLTDCVNRGDQELERRRDEYARTRDSLSSALGSIAKAARRSSA